MFISYFHQICHHFTAMNIVSRLAWILLSLGIVISSQAQTQPAPPTVGKVSGKLTDGKSNPLSYATVTVLRADSSVVGGDLSKDDGTFSVSPTGIGNFKVRVEAIGITTKFINVQITAEAPNKELGTIKLNSSETNLKGVEVVAEKPVMELKVDKKVFNVEKNTTTAGGSAADVLANVPSVSVDGDGNVSLRGKSDVTILIDGKPATLLGSDVNSALQSLPASSIDNVEVITNPSAKYDAQGLSGIINIITKKDQRFGVNGNITLGAGTRDKYNGNLGLNAHKGKWNVFLNSSFRINNTYNDIITNRQNKDSLGNLSGSSHTFEHAPRHFNGFFNSIGATYDLDKNNSITLTENINKMDFGFKDYADYTVYNGAGETGATSMFQHKYSEGGGGPFSTSTALDYKHKFKKKDEELSVDATFASTTIQRTQLYLTDNYADPGMTSPSPGNTIRENAPGHGGNNSVNVWADYSDPLFTKNGKLGLGFKSQIYNFHSGNNPLRDSFDNTAMQSPYYFDSALAATYDYQQQIHAAYINWSDQVGKFSYQVGLRGEYSYYSGTDKLPYDTSFSNTFANLFPSAFVSYQLANQQSIYLNYSRRVNRPNFFQLIPFKDVSNPGTINEGNPGLLPEFVDNIEFSYNKQTKRGDNIILSAYYQHTKNLIERISIVDTTDVAYKNWLLTVPQNIASAQTYGLDITGNVKILPIWDAIVNVNLFQNNISARAVDNNYSSYLTDVSGVGWFGKINTNLRLPAGFSLQVNGNYESKKVIAQGSIRETYWVDVALKKSFLKGKATLIANCSDVFKTHHFITDYTLPYYDETINRIKETRVGNLTFTYRFGKSDLGNKGGGKKPAKTNNNDKPKDNDRENNLKDNGDDDNGGGQGGGNGGGNGGGGNGGGRGAHN